jgi:hypothetical protein
MSALIGLSSVSLEDNKIEKVTLLRLLLKLVTELDITTEADSEFQILTIRGG